MIPRPLDNDFAEWAFGPQLWFDFLNWEKDCLDLLYAWNDRHSDLYRCHEDEAVEDSLKMMKQIYNQHLQKEQKKMDKKMHKVTNSMKAAGKDILGGKPKLAAKVLKGAEKANEKLVKIDKDVRDPLVKKAKESMKKGCK
jgi:hypothetical protein